MAEAYCVKDKKKVEIKNPDADHDEERQAGHEGHLPGVRRQRLPHRRLTRRRRGAPGSARPRDPGPALDREPGPWPGSRDSRRPRPSEAPGTRRSATIDATAGTSSTASDRRPIAPSWSAHGRRASTAGSPIHAPIATPAPVLALDLGGTHLRTAVVTQDGRIHQRRRTRTPLAAGGDGIVETAMPRAERRPGRVDRGRAARRPARSASRTRPPRPGRGPDHRPAQHGRHVQGPGPRAATVRTRWASRSRSSGTRTWPILGETAFGASRGFDGRGLPHGLHRRGRRGHHRRPAAVRPGRRGGRAGPPVRGV